MDYIALLIFIPHYTKGQRLNLRHLKNPCPRGCPKFQRPFFPGCWGRGGGQGCILGICIHSRCSHQDPHGSSCLILSCQNTEGLSGHRCPHPQVLELTGLSSLNHFVTSLIPLLLLNHPGPQDALRRFSRLFCSDSPEPFLFWGFGAFPGCTWGSNKKYLLLLNPKPTWGFYYPSALDFASQSGRRGQTSRAPTSISIIFPSPFLHPQIPTCLH